MSATDGSDSDRQVAWVFDLNKCNGCPTCVTACHDLWADDDDRGEQWWCTVETKPSEGHPKGWEHMGGGYDDEGNLVLGDQPTDETTHDQVRIDWDSTDRTDEGHPTVDLEEEPEWTFNWEEDEGTGEHPRDSWHFYLPKICMQCSNPSCVEACPEEAIVKREEDGIVVIDEYACDGNRYCQRACPYKVIWFDEDRGTAGKEDPDLAADGGEWVVDRDGDGRDDPDGDGEWVVRSDGGESTDPASDGEVSRMCHGCVPRVEEDVAPACARSCPARAVHFGELGDPDSSVHKLVNEWGVALPLKPDANTSPNVYYVPPLSPLKLDDEGRFTDEERIPVEYLEGLFGDDVRDVLETIREHRERIEEGGESELIDTLIGYEWPEDFFGSYTTHPDDLIGGDAA